MIIVLFFFWRHIKEIRKTYRILALILITSQEETTTSIASLIVYCLCYRKSNQLQSILTKTGTF